MMTDELTMLMDRSIERIIPGTGKLRFIEVKGRASGAETITVSRNEIRGQSTTRYGDTPLFTGFNYVFKALGEHKA